MRDLGCTMPRLLEYLESKWLIGMTWDNYGKGVEKWTLDHIKPLSVFNLEDKSEQLAAVHYTNLQPLWWIDNIRKGNKYAPVD